MNLQKVSEDLDDIQEHHNSRYDSAVLAFRRFNVTDKSIPDKVSDLRDRSRKTPIDTTPDVAGLLAMNEDFMEFLTQKNIEEQKAVKDRPSMNLYEITNLTPGKSSKITGNDQSNRAINNLSQRSIFL